MLTDNPATSSLQSRGFLIKSLRLDHKEIKYRCLTKRVKKTEHKKRVSLYLTEDHTCRYSFVRSPVLFACLPPPLPLDCDFQ